MEKGIVYVMSTAVRGLVKIGKTQSSQFETRMKFLEDNGYANVTGLRRVFAIEVNDYNEKENLIHKIFSKSRLSNTELFSIDIDLIISLLSSFEGRTLYPSNENKQEIFEGSIQKINKLVDLPDGNYTLTQKIRDFGDVKGNAIVRNSQFVLLKGSVCRSKIDKNVSSVRKNIKIENNILQEDVICSSPSTAGVIVTGKSINGWTSWKDSLGNKIEIYRSENN